MLFGMLFARPCPRQRDVSASARVQVQINGSHVKNPCMKGRMQAARMHGRSRAWVRWSGMLLSQCGRCEGSTRGQAEALDHARQHTTHTRTRTRRGTLVVRVHVHLQSCSDIARARQTQTASSAIIARLDPRAPLATLCDRWHTRIGDHACTRSQPNTIRRMHACARCAHGRCVARAHFGRWADRTCARRLARDGRDIDVQQSRRRLTAISEQFA